MADDGHEEVRDCSVDEHGAFHFLAFGIGHDFGWVGGVGCGGSLVGFFDAALHFGEDLFELLGGDAAVLHYC